MTTSTPPIEPRNSQYRKLTLAAILIPAILFATGNATAAPRQNTEERVHQALADRGLDPEAVLLPYALTDEMREWAHAKVLPRITYDQKLNRLLMALLGGEELRLAYSWGYTGTAADVFETRLANCLAFTNLFVGMAREVGVPVYFLAVETETYRRQGEFVVVSDHIAVGRGVGNEIRMYDFSERRSEELPRVRQISDLTAIAMFHSNRGAEVLQQGKVDEALRWLRTAVAVDDNLANAWVNLGVALRRAGDSEAAEGAYRKALEVDPRTYGAYQNLASLLRIEGRREEARQLELALRKSPNRNPYTYLSLGDISFRSGRLDEARRLYRRAAHLNRSDAESYAALGQVAAAAGDLTTARKMLRKARKRDDDNRRAVRLASLLADG